MFSEIFSPYKHVLAVLFRKWPTFFAYNTKQVNAVILESSQINDLFQNRQIYSRRIFQTSWNFLDMVSVRLKN